MVNLFQSLCSVILILTIASADDDMSISQDDLIEIFLPMGKDCTPQPEKEHVIELIQMKEDAQMPTKCFRRCLFEKFELIAEGSNTLNIEKTVELMGMMYSDKEDDIKDFSEKCSKANEGKADKCEQAHALAMCMFSEMKQRGYKIPEIK